MSGETKHSPEPWREAIGWAYAADNSPVLCGPPNAVARAVACVNACAGIPTTALEAGSLDEALRALESYAVDDPDRTWGIDVLRTLGRFP